MKFKSDPGRVLTDAKTHRVIGMFDEKGIFETDDPYYTERLKLLFPVGDDKAAADRKKPAAQKKSASAKSAPKKVKA
jgi:hypothetical protein